MSELMNNAGAPGVVGDFVGVEQVDELVVVGPLLILRKESPCPAPRRTSELLLGELARASKTEKIKCLAVLFGKNIHAEVGHGPVTSTVLVLVRGTRFLPG